MSSKHLLLLSCSGRKRNLAGEQPAYKLYDGPCYRSIRKHIVDYKDMPADLYVISAKYGLIRGDELIEQYELRMTSERARSLRPRISAQFREMLQSKEYEEVFINMGKIYLSSIDGFELLLNPSVNVDYAPGTIGERTSQTMKWINKMKTRNNSCGNT